MIAIRPAQAADAADLGRMGAALARQHHDFDAQRFMLPKDLEEGYRWWLSHEMENPKAVVLVAARGDAVVGYVYARVEGKDWNKLLDRHGELVDIWVDEAARGTGVGGLLVGACFQRLADLGVPRVVLMSAAKNEAAHRLFARHGFRQTMVEMTRETGVTRRKRVSRT